MTRVNIGCGQTPTTGWRNFDNSLSLRFARVPLLPDLLRRARLIQDEQFRFIQFAREHDVEYADATSGLPLPSNACEVIYSSHMLEHLDRTGSERFLSEALRVLQPGGLLRIAVPDIRKHVEEYVKSGDADTLIASTHLSVPDLNSLRQRVRLLLTGARNHQWMYDGESLCRLLSQRGFVDVEVMPPGTTRIPAPGALDLHERSAESVYVEARKPTA